MGYKFLPHTADVKILVEEKTLEKAFLASALAMVEVMSDKSNIKAKIKKEISVEGKDKESLLYNFLEEFLYLFDAENFILSKIDDIKIKKAKGRFLLTAYVMGDNASDYKFTNDVKAVTYNEMFVKKQKGKVIIQFVLDV